MVEKNKNSIWLWIIAGVIAIWICGNQGNDPVSSLTASTTERRSIYAGPNVNYGVIGHLPAGSKVTLTGRQGDTWVTFRFNGQQGWIQDIFLEIDGNSSRLLEEDFVFIPTPTKRPQVSNQDLISSQDLTVPCSFLSSELSGKQVVCMIERAHCSYQRSTSGDPTFCNDAPYPNHNFTLLVWGEDWSDYDGECIIVNGAVSMYQGKPQIIATGRWQVSSCQ